MASVIKHTDKSTKELEEFFAFASHDLQDPLRSINAYLRVLKEKCACEDAQELIEIVQDSCLRMMCMINGMFNYSRAGKCLAMINVDSEAVFWEATGLLAAAVSESGAVITSNQLPVVKADAACLRTIFLNLIQNAIKYRQPGVAPVIMASCHDDETHYFFSIADNGIGIKEKNIQRLFTIYRKFDHVDLDGRGVGFGLAICKKIVADHGGEISVQSEFGVGSTFTFSICK